MDHPAEITFHGMEATPDAESRLHHRIERLEHLLGRLVSCRVAVDAPHQSQRTGNRYAVRVEARIPAKVFVVDRQPGDLGAHEDLHVAIRDAFDAMERQARRWKETHSGHPHPQAEPLRGRVESLRSDLESGQILLTDGRLVYFHRHAVAEDAFDSLSEGAAVEVALDPGKDSDAGPHASFVRPISEVRMEDRQR